ncbi:MAG: flagellin [Rhodobacteraceae bacterium]|nr:MAG: flagellin [Paracoccaceae bacterium]
MSSLLTNTSAMVSLQTLRVINKDLGATQNQISTGMRIANARDNAALWSIATVMRSDVTGFKAISESLALGSATLNVGRDGAETVASLLDQLKGRVVTAQEENVDRNKVQADVRELVDQIRVVVAGSQFNGLNLLNGDREVSVLASMNRSAVAGLPDDVAPDYVKFRTQDLSTTAGVEGGGGPIPDAMSIEAPVGFTNPLAAGEDLEIEFPARAVNAGDSYRITLTNTDGDDFIYLYVAAQGDTLNDVVSGLARQISLDAPDDGGGRVAVTRAADPTTQAPRLSFRSDTEDYTVALGTQTGSTEPTGRLRGIDKFDVSTDRGAAAALQAMEHFIQSAINAAAHFGSAQGSVDSADMFVGRLIDSLTEGVGALVDADMEAASARLQALQVQQQLGIQALSIANQQPQNILALFQ